jgi:rare lipoprotein A (peptidoglycan hydrolase)
MKQVVITVLLLGTCAVSLAAQDRQEGMAVTYHDANSGSGLYVTHRTLPFGTKLVVTNPVNLARVEAQVGGRPGATVKALIEISPAIASRLGIYRDVPTRVWIDIIRRTSEASQLAMRSRFGALNQYGIAQVRPAGNSLIAFHASLPMGTKIKLTGANGLSVVVTVTGRIQASKERLIEISPQAARELGYPNETFIKLQLNTLGF